MLRRMNSKYNGRCKVCRTPYRIGDPIYWSPQTKALCIDCGAGKKVRPSDGASQVAPKASAEFQGRASTDEKGWSRFVIDWPDLKDKAKRLIKGDSNFIGLPGNRQQSEGFVRGGSWHGFTGGQLDRWLTSGFEAEAIKGLAEFTPPIREKRRLQFLEEGDELHLDLAWSGADNYFSEWTKREIIPGLAVEATITFSAAVQAEIVNAYLTWLCRALYSLESSGVDCQVTLSVIGDGLWSGGKAHTVIRVKKENETSDFLSWSAMLSPAGLRGLGFVAFALHGESENKTVSSHLGHGRIPETQSWNIGYDAERRIVKVNAQYDATSFPEEKMTNDLRGILKQLSNSK